MTTILTGRNKSQWDNNVMRRAKEEYQQVPQWNPRLEEPGWPIGALLAYCSGLSRYAAERQPQLPPVKMKR